MKFNHEYVIKRIGDETILVHQSADAVDFSKIITLNETSEIIVNALIDGLNVSQIVEKITSIYDVNYEKCLEDVTKIIDTLKKLNIVYED